jgi:predicted RecA/RadA family phage recombinase
LQITENLTIEAWINPTNFSKYDGIFSKTAGGGGNIPAPYDFYLSAGGGIPEFFSGNGSAFSSVSGSSAPSAGAWSHIAVTLSGSVVTHYLNGLNNGSGTDFATPGDGGTKAIIGSRTDLVTMFKGGMDEIRVSNIARSADWIATEYNNQSNPSNFYSVGAAVTPLPQATTPQISPAAGSYPGSVNVTITDATNGATITYTTDGSTPIPGSNGMTISSGGSFTLTSSATVTAIASATNYTNSNTAAVAYTITALPQAATPQISPAAASYSGSVNVTITDATSGAAITYTTDGSTPIPGSNGITISSGGTFTLTSSATVTAIASAGSFSNSLPATVSYTVTSP